VTPREIGRLAGRCAAASLLEGTWAIAEAARAKIHTIVKDFADGHVRAWQQLVEEVATGQTEQRRRYVPGAAFRPEFHRRQADELFESERWTESFWRYVVAGEVLLGEVYVPELKVAGLDVKPGAEKWFSAFLRWAREQQLQLELRPEFEEFQRVYGLRSKKFMHGKAEASMTDAVDARAAFQGLRALLQEVLGRSYGISLEAVQKRALVARSMLIEPSEVEAFERMNSEAQEVLVAARTQLRALLEQPAPGLPVEVATELERLTDRDRAVADESFASVMKETGDSLRDIWTRAQDLNTVLEEVIVEIASGPTGDGETE